MAIGRITGQMLSANLARSGTDLTFETNLLALDVSNSRVGIGTASPATTLHISATDAIRLASGTTAQRPGSPANGDMRYNTTLSTIEGYSNSGWANMASGDQIKDADSDTFVKVEAQTDPGDQDRIHINAGGTEVMVLAAATTEFGAATSISNSASTITGLVTNGNIAITPNGTGEVDITKVDIAAGEIDGTTIGANSAGAGTFTVLTATTGVNLDDGGDGAIDGCVIGGSTAAAGTFTNLTVTTAVNIDDGGDGAIDGCIIGASTAAAGNFTALDATGALTVGGNATVTGNLTVNGTTSTVATTNTVIADNILELNNGISASTNDAGIIVERGSTGNNACVIWDESADAWVFGTTTATGADKSGGLTIAGGEVQSATGTFTNVDGIVGANTAAAGTFTSLTVTTAVNIDDGGDGAIDGCIIGANTAVAGTFTDLTTTGNTVIGNATGDALTFHPGAWTLSNGVTITGTWANLGTVTTADINGGTVDGANIGAASAGTGAFTTLSATGAVSLDGGAFTFNDTSADLDFRCESNGNANMFFIDGGNDRIGMKTASPAYDLDIASSTDAVRLPVGTTDQRPSAATGIIRFNSTTGKYEGCQDGSTFVNLAVTGDTPTISKVSATGDGSTTAFVLFSTAPNAVANVLVFIDNVYQEPTENYSISSTTITFTSAPHSAARIFAITGFDNTALASGGVARTETSSTNFTSSATTIMSFNAATYRAAELFIILQDSANSEYACMKATVTHNGSTAFGNIYGVTNTGGETSDLGTITFVHDGSSTVNVKAVSSGGVTAATVQYSLAS
ncbi:MAG: hypothetical protein H8D84_02090 [Proteobacteria bacterium]|nr:hypothetical protein [Pseudomonadota bacterium]